MITYTHIPTHIMNASSNESRLRAALASAAGTCAVVAVVFLSAVQEYNALQGQAVQMMPMPTPTVQQMPGTDGATPTPIMAPGMTPMPGMDQNMNQGMVPMPGMNQGTMQMAAPMQLLDPNALQMQGQGVVPMMAPLTAPPLAPPPSVAPTMPPMAPITTPTQQHQAAPVVAPTSPVPTIVKETDTVNTAAKPSLWQRIGNFVIKLFGWEQ